MPDPSPCTIPPQLPSDGGVPLYINSQLPVLQDGAKPSLGGWSGANKISLKLLRCLEPLRDLMAQMELVALLPIRGRDKRVTKLLATPLHTLSAQTLSLLNTLKDDRTLRPRLNAAARTEVAAWLARLKEGGLELDGDSGLTTFRNKMGAHVDEVAVTHPAELWKKVDLVAYLSWAEQLIIALAHATALDAYAWIQLDTSPDIWVLMSVDGTAVHLHVENGEATAIVAVTSVQSPKLTLFGELALAQHLCRRLLPPTWKPPLSLPTRVVTSDGIKSVSSSYR
jgi:hypothetical protein